MAARGDGVDGSVEIEMASPIALIFLSENVPAIPVPIRRARDPETLYEAVADHDLVICPDDPLADAIDRRVTEPCLGTFATTPRRMATGRREPVEVRAAFLELVDLVRAEIDA